MNNVDINDIRDLKEFKGITFSKFKKTDVRKELLNSLINSKIEPACYWSAELICSCNYSELWDTIICFYSKYVHLGNPKIAIYLEMRINNFKEIISSGFKNNEIRMRNNAKTRRLFAEVMCVLCDAKKKHCFQDIKIAKTDFDMTQLTDRFKAPNVNFSDVIFLKGDPRELYIAINEFAYSISSAKNVMTGCYWIEWIIEFESKCKSNHEKLKCERRANMPVESKFQMDVVWIIWDVLFHESKNKSKIVQKIIKSLLSLFTLKYSTSCCKKRKYILYFVVSMLCEEVVTNEEIIREDQKIVISNVLNKIDSIYQQIKKNEENPGTEYLFKDVKQRNLEKTIEKLETMNSFGETFIPRMDK
jgi:hypothetical protein